MRTQSTKLALVSILGVGSCTSAYYIYKWMYKYLWLRTTQKYYESSIRSVIVVSCDTDWDQKCIDLLGKMTKIGAVGLDCEWVAMSTKNTPVALLQLSSYTGDCLLIRLSRLSKVPPALKRFISSENIIKLGVGIQKDAQMLLHSHSMMVNGWVDIRFLACESYRLGQCDPEWKKKLGLKTLSLRHLGIKIEDSEMLKRSNWEVEELTGSQISYAATDAHMGISLLLKFVSDMCKDECPQWMSTWEDTTKKRIRQACKSYLCCPYKDAKANQNVTDQTRKGHSVPNNKPSKRLKQRTYMPRQKPLYHNCRLLAPDDEPLCTCDPEKGLWYISKGLGVEVSQEPFIVKLNFEPSGRPMKEGADGLFYLQERLNCCVVCGQKNSYLRKNIVPRDYRRFFPDILKSHQSHDVVLLCIDCHQRSNIKDKDIRYTLATEFDAPIGYEQDVKVTVDPKLKRVRNAATALHTSKSHMPESRIRDLEDIVKSYCKTDQLTEQHIVDTSQMEVAIVNSKYVAHGFKIVMAYKRIGLIQLEARFRQWFLDTMKPKFMPDNWSIAHNHAKLKFKMDNLPEDSPDREDYQMALFGIDSV